MTIHLCSEFLLDIVVRLQDYASDPGVSVDKTKEESLQFKRLALSVVSCIEGFSQYRLTKAKCCICL